MERRNIQKGDGSNYSDAEKLEVMVRSKPIRENALRMILAVESQITESKRKAKMLKRDGKAMTMWEIWRLDVLRAIARDFRPLKQKIEKETQE